MKNLIKEQKKVWNTIAPEWNEFKKKSSKLSEKFLSKQSGKIIDIGAGSGRHLKKIKNGKMYLVDFSEKMIELAKKNAEKKKIKAEFCVADMTCLPYKDNFFDGGICISALHCLKKEKHLKAIKEMFRVLKPNAELLVMVWNKNNKRFKREKEKEKLIGWKNKGKRYYYLFEEKEIFQLFESVGFKIIEKNNCESMIRFISKKN